MSLGTLVLRSTTYSRQPRRIDCSLRRVKEDFIQGERADYGKQIVATVSRFSLLRLFLM